MRLPAPWRRCLASLPLLLLAAGPARAVDGVREISQACSGAGCFTGDTSDFPVQITATGSYRLTSNLSLPDGNTTGILVLAPDVSIDLNGFQIGCPGCAPGTGNGVESVSGASRLRVRNGAIREVGGSGIVAADLAVIEDVAVVAARSHGIVAAQGAHVTGCIVEGSGGNGIDIGPAGSVHAIRSRSNGGDGIRASRATVADSIASENAGAGITCQTRCDVLRSVAVGNAGDGIYAGEARVEGNTVRSNQFGITAFDSLVIGNAVADNAFHGLQLGSSTAFASNVLQDNNGGGAQVASGNPIGPNACGNDTVCP